MRVVILMAHTNDRTLLASLGFADPDKKDRRHTLACQYLCQPDVAVRLWHRINPMLALRRPVPPEPIVCTGHKEYGVRECPPDPTGMWEADHISAEMESKVTTDRGFLIGFVDVALTGKCVKASWNQDDTKSYSPRTYSMTFYGDRMGMCVEVKASWVDVAEIARQIETYRNNEIAAFRSYSMPLAWVVATCYPMPPSDKATLSAKGIHHVWLGDGFKAYCAQRESEQVDQEDGL